jgi:hypothetical protein
MHPASYHGGTAAGPIGIASLGTTKITPGRVIATRSTRLCRVIRLAPSPCPGACHAAAPDGDRVDSLPMDLCMFISVIGVGIGRAARGLLVREDAAHRVGRGR